MSHTWKLIKGWLSVSFHLTGSFHLTAFYSLEQTSFPGTPLCKDLFTPHFLGSPASPGRGLIVEGACDACLHLFIAMDSDRDVNAF